MSQSLNVLPPKTLEWPEGSGKWHELIPCTAIDADAYVNIATLVRTASGKVTERMADGDVTGHNQGWLCGAVFSGSSLYRPCAAPVPQEEEKPESALFEEFGRLCLTYKQSPSDELYEAIVTAQRVLEARAVEQKLEPAEWIEWEGSAGDGILATAPSRALRLIEDSAYRVRLEAR